MNVVLILNVAKIGLFFILPCLFARKKIQQRNGDECKSPGLISYVLRDR